MRGFNYGKQVVVGLLIILVSVLFSAFAIIFLSEKPYSDMKKEAIALVEKETGDKSAKTVELVNSNQVVVEVKGKTKTYLVGNGSQLESLKNSDITESRKNLNSVARKEANLTIVEKRVVWQWHTDDGFIYFDFNDGRQLNA
jgi:uncharacterized protein YpmB